MRAGATLRTVTGTTRLSSSQTWVMPSFSPTMALVAMAIPLCPGAREARAVVSDAADGLCCGPTTGAVSLGDRSVLPAEAASGAIGCAGWSPPPIPRGGETGEAGAPGPRIEPRDLGRPQVHGEEMLSAASARAKRGPV